DSPFERRLKRIDYLVPGMIGIIIFWVGAWQSIAAVVSEKELETINRLISSPASSVAILSGKAISSYLVLFLSVILASLTGIFAFNVILYWKFELLIPLIILSGLNSIGLGL
ncbi:MAG: ABC transporter permease, partial [Candidatus Hodarchaeota archaeon]